MRINQASFLRDAMRRLEMTRDQFSERIAVKRKTLDSWLLPPEGNTAARAMPDMAWKFIGEIVGNSASKD